MTKINSIQFLKLLLVSSIFLFTSCDSDDDSTLVDTNIPISPDDSGSEPDDPINTAEPVYSDFGPYTTMTEEVVDDSFNPTLRVFRPTKDIQETYPLVIFQQGANMPGVNNITTESYDLYTQHLASYGYVVVVISLDIIQDTLFSNTKTGDISDSETIYNWIKTQTEDPSTWWSQYTDISKTIVGGHSFGGVTTSELLAFGTEKAQGIVYFASFPGETQASATYEGKVLSIAGSEDTASTPEETKAGYNSFEASSCKNYILIEGLDHGGFGDYEFDEQPVGTIGREDATATIRHYFVSFLEANFKNDENAIKAFYSENNQPEATNEFINEGCEAITSLSN